MAAFEKSARLYPHPFSRGYWRDAARELKDTKMLVFAALMIALRVAMKLLYIPLAPGLRINTSFLANALGAAVYGPVVAALCAVVTDLLGFLLVNDGSVYFLPFVLTEVAGSVIFALFLYRARVTPARVMLSRFCICLGVNVLLQTPIQIWYYALFMGGKPYALTVPRLVKNLFMFPIESVVLTLVLRALLPVTDRLGLTYGAAKDALRFSKRQLALLIALTLVGTASVAGYLGYYYDTTSLSASYSDAEREEKNREMLPIVLENGEFDAETTVTVVESAKKRFLGSEITYTVAVYSAAPDAAADAARMDAFFGYSRSPAAKDGDLTREATATIVINEKTGEPHDVSVVAEP